MRARTKRNSNIEIIKLIAVFLIILSSALPYGATYRGETVYVNLKLLRGEHSVNNAKLSFMRIYFFICQCCTKTIGAVAIVTNSIYHYLSLFVDK